ncbi:MSRB5 [Symbiodinium natans]|uniref:MSRB5 protein n=1 Tax=Symbiodinium natans TaxID=878477 RepID=A0A812NIY1_9DINO|nr:MSRB5 [Symbiodinium natans]
MRQLWKVVGGADQGILVREGRDLQSPACAERLRSGALVEELELRVGRLRFRKYAGDGPLEGWASVSLASGKVLLVRVAEMPWPLKPRDEEVWRMELQPEVFQVLRDKVTEPRNSGEYNSFFPSAGHFRCAGCQTPLYSPQSKMKANCGWPAFSKCYTLEAEGLASVVAQVDWTSGGREILCRNCGGHLGHVFMDGAFHGGDTPERHCVNSLSVVWVEEPKALEEVVCDMRTFERQLREHRRQDEEHFPNTLNMIELGS